MSVNKVKILMRRWMISLFVMWNRTLRIFIIICYFLNSSYYRVILCTLFSSILNNLLPWPEIACKPESTNKTTVFSIVQSSIRPFEKKKTMQILYSFSGTEASVLCLIVKNKIKYGDNLGAITFM